MGTKYVYIDIICLDNFIMNLLMLWATSKILKVREALWRLCIAACIGAVYAVTAVVFRYAIFGWWGTKIVVSALMLLAGFKWKTAGKFFKYMGTFYGTAFAFGGAAFGLYYFTQGIVSLEGGVFYIRSFPAKILSFSSSLLIILISTLGPGLYRRWMSASLIYSLIIKYNGVDIYLDALLDTGHSLCDPITHSPILIAEYTKIQGALPKKLADIYSAGTEIDFDYTLKALAGSNLEDRLRIIPYSALGKPGGLLIGFKPDRVLVSINNNWCENHNIIVAIYNDRISREGNYHALISPEILSA